MSDPLYAFPTVCGQTLRALARYPSRVAFSWPGGSITYRGATELIGRIQKVFMQLGLEPGARVAFLTANRPTHGVRASLRNCPSSRSPGCIPWDRSTISSFRSRIRKHRCWSLTPMRSAIAVAISQPGHPA
jgi:hypothetical protein